MNNKGFPLLPIQGVVQIVTTTDQRPVAESLAEDLLERRLAACVQIDGPMTSLYRWEGRIETSEEWRCVIKTLAELVEPVTYRIGLLHTYDVPEILVSAVDSVSEDYARWLREQVEKPS